MTKHLRALALLCCLAGCDGNAAAPEDSPPPIVVIATGDLQEAPAGLRLPVDPTVRVTNTAGVPQPGVEILWRVTEGAGVVDAHRTFTDSAGFASIRWTLGDEVGQQLLHASTEGSGGVTFRARSELFFTSVAAGWRHTCGLDPRGLAWCWGNNFWGQLGNGTRDNSYDSRAVTGRQAFVHIEAGMLHTCALTAEGDAHCWGDNGYGQLGDGTTRNRSVPGAVLGGQRFSSLALGYTHTCGITLAGELYCWGNNGEHQVGIGIEELCNLGGVNEPCVRLPTRVALPGVAMAVAAGEWHSCAVTGPERAYCWGLNDWGQLGIGAFGGRSAAPAEVLGGLRFQDIVAWGRSTCGLSTNGNAFCWGRNSGGNLGINSVLNTDRPTAVVSLGIALTQLGTGDSHTCGLTAAGDVHCWGQVLGNGSGAGSLVPVAVTGGRQYSALSVGGAHTCGYSNGIWCWGSNQYGQLGLRPDSVSEATSPVLVRRAAPPTAQ